MDIILLLKALILGIVEGLTEFLPVSSTGHLILVGDLLDFNDDKGKLFEIVIQFGAILAVCWEYRARLGAVCRGSAGERARCAALRPQPGCRLPARCGARAAVRQARSRPHLFNPVPVALAFIVGGLLILWAERRKHVIRVQEVDEMGWRDALKIGLAQSLALIPGTSRSGATIIGGLFFGLSRQAATEFSFFLAIPTLFAATAYESIKYRHLLNADDLGMFAVGGVASFVSAFLAVRGLLRYISRHDFSVFAWYRIVFGMIVLLTAYTGAVSWSVS